MKTSLRILTASVLLGTSVTGSEEQVEKLVVHEWGTFTVLQDSAGRAIPGVNINEEALPSFVHRLNPNLSPEASALPPAFGGNRYAAIRNTRAKGIQRAFHLALMRMETPIIYFHPPNDTPLTLDVSVKFRKGWLSEWFPKAKNSAPGFPDRLGTGQPGCLAWNDLQVGVEAPLPKTEEHVWTAPRQVKCAPVQTADGKESEQYLFYRGVAQLQSPIRVVTSNDSAAVISSCEETNSSFL